MFETQSIIIKSKEKTTMKTIEKIVNNPLKEENTEIDGFTIISNSSLLTDSNTINKKNTLVTQQVDHEEFSIIELEKEKTIVDLKYEFHTTNLQEAISKLKALLKKKLSEACKVIIFQMIYSLENFDIQSYDFNDLMNNLNKFLIAFQMNIGSLQKLITFSLKGLEYLFSNQPSYKKIVKKIVQGTKQLNLIKKNILALKKSFTI